MYEVQHCGVKCFERNWKINMSRHTSARSKMSVLCFWLQPPDSLSPSTYISSVNVSPRLTSFACVLYTLAISRFVWHFLTPVPNCSSDLSCGLVSISYFLSDECDGRILLKSVQTQLWAFLTVSCNFCNFCHHRTWGNLAPLLFPNDYWNAVCIV